MKTYREDKSQKPDYTLMPLEQEERIIRHFEFGAKKYARDDWKTYGPKDRLDRYASLHRHLRQAQRGDKDEDHLAAVVLNAIILMHIEAQS